METRDSQHSYGDDVSCAPQEIKKRLTAENAEHAEKKLEGMIHCDLGNSSQAFLGDLGVSAVKRF